MKIEMARHPDKSRRARASYPASIVLLIATILGASTAQNAFAQRGIRVDDINRQGDPCADFYDYANGAWRAANPIPWFMDRWSRRWASGEQNKENVRKILAELAGRSDWPKGSANQLAGDHYAACMNEEQVNRLGMKPAKAMLAAIEAIEDGPVGSGHPTCPIIIDLPVVFPGLNTLEGAFFKRNVGFAVIDATRY